MIYLFSGAPGSGKTASALAMLIKEMEGREVFLYGVRGLKPQPGWTVIDKDQVLDWESLPDKSVVMVDEAWQVWPNTRNAAASAGVGVDLEALRIHRHRGFDFILTSQSPMDLSINLRRLVNEHRHFRTMFGTNNHKIYTWNRCAEKCDEWGEQQDAVVSQGRVPKTAWGLYESTVEDTSRRKLPWQVYGLAVAAVVIAFLGFRVWAGGLAIGDMAEEQQQVAASDPGGSAVPGEPVTVYEEQPEWVPGLPQEYRASVKPQDFPRPQCIRYGENKGSCKCYTQQATPMPEISLAQCNKIVDGGYFDPTRSRSMNM